MMFMAQIKYHREHCQVDPFTKDENLLVGSIMHEVVRGIDNPNYAWALAEEGGRYVGFGGGALIVLPEMFDPRAYFDLEWFYPLSLSNRPVLDYLDNWAKSKGAKERRATRFTLDDAGVEIIKRNGMTKLFEIYKKDL